MLSPALLEWKNQGKIIILDVPSSFKVFVVEFGDVNATEAETLLLLHGFPESSYSYRGSIPECLTFFKRIILFDFIGFGFSEKPKQGFSYSIFEQTEVALSVWRQLGVRGGHVLAHDMADSVLTELLVRTQINCPIWFDKGFQSVTFTNGGMVRDKAHLRIGQKLLLSPLGRYFSGLLSYFPIFEHQLKSTQGNDGLSEQDITDMYQMVTYQSWPSLFYQLIRYQNERLRFEKPRWLPILKTLTCPVHISWGVDDRVCPPAIAKDLKERVCSQAQLTLVDGLGHFCQIQDPKRWSEPLLTFWRGC